MKITEIRRKSAQELQKDLYINREKVRQLRFDLASGKVKNVRDIRKIRREIARIITIIKEKSNIA